MSVLFKNARHQLWVRIRTDVCSFFPHGSIGKIPHFSPAHRVDPVHSSGDRPCRLHPLRPWEPIFFRLSGVKENSPFLAGFERLDVSLWTARPNRSGGHGRLCSFQYPPVRLPACFRGNRRPHNPRWCHGNPNIQLQKKNLKGACPHPPGWGVNHYPYPGGNPGRKASRDAMPENVPG